MVRSAGIDISVAVAEIAGCFAFWAWLRLEKSVLWTVPGVTALIAFALFLTRIEAGFAGRTYAVYGGVYIAAALVWLWVVEGAWPDRWDLVGPAVSVLGGGITLFGARASL